MGRAQEVGVELWDVGIQLTTLHLGIVVMDRPAEK